MTSRIISKQPPSGKSSLRAALAFFIISLLLGGAAVAAGELDSRVLERKLPNGMTLLALPRNGAPVVTLEMTFKAGSVDEGEGLTGTAHLLEHMLFKGTEKLGTSDWEKERPLVDQVEAVGKKMDAELKKGEGASAEVVQRLKAELGSLIDRERDYIIKDEIDAIYSRNGGAGFNAFTTTDLTSYIISLPSNRLELWAAIESDRMKNPVMREYYVEREVVGKERMMRRESEPGAVLHEELMRAAFESHPYRNPVIGLPEDLDTLDIDIARNFFRDFYGPDNAVAVCVGNFDPQEFFSLMERYFGPIPPSGFQRREPGAEGPPKGPKKVEVTLDAEPRAIIAYRKPTLPRREDYVFDIIDGILSGGRSSRLWRALVEEEKVASEVYTVNGSPGARYDNLFMIYVEPAHGVTLEEAVNSVKRQLEALATSPPREEEMGRVVKALLADRVKSLVSDVGMARKLSYFQTVAGDWRYIEEHPKVLASITPEEVRKVAAEFFTPSNETLAVLRSGKEAEGGAK